MQKLAGNTALAADIVAEIVDRRADGVPLEELTNAVLESAAQGDRIAAVLATTSLAAQSVPATLHASLMARLDRLGPAAKEIAQIGAVLGREFAYELIEPVAQRSTAELQAAWANSVRPGCFLRGTAPALFLPVQACAGAGRRLFDLAAPARSGNCARASQRCWPRISPTSSAPARTAGRSPDGGRRHRARGQAMAEGRAACRGAIGLPRSDCPFRTGSRPAALAPGKPSARRPRNRAAAGVGAMFYRQRRRRSEAGLYAGARACRERRRAEATV